MAATPEHWRRVEETLRAAADASHAFAEAARELIAAQLQEPPPDDADAPPPLGTPLAPAPVMNLAAATIPVTPEAPPVPPPPIAPTLQATYLPECRACKAPLEILSPPAGFTRDALGFEGEWQPLNGSAKPCTDHPTLAPAWVPRPAPAADEPPPTKP